jgi:cell division septal protein FtsQ
MFFEEKFRKMTTTTKYMSISLPKNKRKKIWLARLMWLLILWVLGVILVGLLSVFIKLVMNFVGLSV